MVGESGSGKSVTMMSLLKLLPMPPAEIVEGRALFENQDLIQMDLNQLRKIRGGKIGFIFQDPMTSLNPVLTVGYQLMEPMREHLGLSREEARKSNRTLGPGWNTDGPKSAQRFSSPIFRRNEAACHDRHRTGL